MRRLSLQGRFMSLRAKRGNPLKSQNAKIKMQNDRAKMKKSV
jgi:hypothetical protein